MKKLLIIFALAIGGSLPAQWLPVLAGSPASVMKTPVFVGSGTPASISTSAKRYTPFTHRATNFASGLISGQCQSVVAIGGAVSGLHVLCETAPGTGKSYDYTLIVNGAATALTVNIADSATSATDATHCVAVNAGDLLSWEASPNNTPAAPTNLTISCVFTSSGVGEGLVTSGDKINLMSNSASAYYGLWSGGTWQNTEINASTIVATGGRLDNLYVQLDGTPGGTANYAFTVYQNGAPTGLTVTVSGTATTGNDTNPGHAITTAAGDVISVQAAPTGTPTARRASLCLRWRPAIPGYAIYGSNGGALSTSATRWIPLVGANTNNVGSGSAATNIQALVPISCTQRSLYAVMSTAAGSTKSRTARSYVSTGSYGSLSATMADPAISAHDSSHTDSLAENAVIFFASDPAGTPAAITYFKWGTVLSVP